MSFKSLLRKWPYFAMLAAAAALAVLAGLAWRPGSVGASIEVVSDRPLRAVHALPTNAIKENAFNPPGATGQARGDIPVDYYDFGAVSARSVVRREFLVINRGSAPLVIQQAYTTCGCTTAELTASVIPPGKASRVTVIFDAGFHPAAGQTVRRGLVLETNDPGRPEAEIWVQASVGR